tara:strand:+ start:249 stop:497 length:249 start_codon:yes stop_codon:yes gene_type:complete
MSVKVGAIVRIEFLDHAQSSQDAMLFECFGRVTAISKTAYCVHHWRYVEDRDRAADQNVKENEDCYAIVKKAVTKIEVIREG